MSHCAHENQFNIVSFYGLEPTSPRFFADRRLEAAAFSSKSMLAIAWRHDQSSSHSAITAPTSPIIDSR